jgi:hypothetical protein
MAVPFFYLFPPLKLETPASNGIPNLALKEILRRSNLALKTVLSGTASR